MAGSLVDLKKIDPEALVSKSVQRGAMIGSKNAENDEEKGSDPKKLKGSRNDIRPLVDTCTIVVNIIMRI